MELKRYLRVVASTGDDDDDYSMVEISTRRAREAADYIEKLEKVLSLAENWIGNRAVHAGKLCTSKQCVCGKALVLFNVIQALEGKDD